MAVEHYKVLKNLGRFPLVLGRGETSADNFEKLTGHRPMTGDLRQNLEAFAGQISHAIVAVNVMQLAPVTKTLLDMGRGLYFA